MNLGTLVEGDKTGFKALNFSFFRDTAFYGNMCPCSEMHLPALKVFGFWLNF